MANIPFLSLKDVTALHGAEINEAVTRVVNNGWYLQGKENERFEETYSKFIGSKYTIGCANGLDALITEHGLEPFELNVQTAARTFVDKVYAIGDYYLDGRIREHSRHIYDLYKLLEVVSLDDSLKELIASVREDRKAHKTCLSVQDGVDMQDILDRIIKENTYKDDYKDITETLLFEELPYETAISAIVKIRDSGLF